MTEWLTHKCIHTWNRHLVHVSGTKATGSMSGIWTMGTILLSLGLALLPLYNLGNVKLNSWDQTKSLENTFWSRGGSGTCRQRCDSNKLTKCECHKQQSTQDPAWEAVDILCNYCKCALCSPHYCKRHFQRCTKKKKKGSEVIAISKAELELLEKCQGDLNCTLYNGLLG